MNKLYANKLTKKEKKEITSKFPKIVNSDKEMLKEMEEYVNTLCNEDGEELIVPVKNKELEKAIVDRLRR